MAGRALGLPSPTPRTDLLLSAGPEVRPDGVGDRPKRRRSLAAVDRSAIEGYELRTAPEWARNYWGDDADVFYTRQLVLGAAHSAVGKALDDGRLVRPTTCSAAVPFKRACSVHIDARHYLGYRPEHRLDVQWLCRSHHRIAHGIGRPDEAVSA